MSTTTIKDNNLCLFFMTSWGAFDKSFRTVLTGLTAMCVFVYSCQTGLISLTNIRSFSQDCPETCQNGRCRDSDHSDIKELEQESSMADCVSLVHFSCEFAVAPLL